MGGALNGHHFGLKRPLWSLYLNRFRHRQSREKKEKYAKQAHRFLWMQSLSIGRDWSCGNGGEHGLFVRPDDRRVDCPDCAVQ
jgi:FAD synthase